MKFKLLSIAGFMLYLMCPGGASAQCYFVYSNNYAVYTNESTDGNNIFTSVLTDGSASMSIHNENCGPGLQIMQNQLASARHTPRAYNMLNSNIGGWGSGAQSCVSCYLSYENDQTLAATTGQVYSWDTSGSVLCTIGGAIFSDPFKNWKVEVAFTRFVTAGYLLDTSSAPHHRDYLIGAYCTAPTTPPDWNPASPPIYFITLDPPGVPTDVVDGKTLCFRVGTSPWACLPAGKWVNSYDRANTTLGNCTHNP